MTSIEQYEHILSTKGVSLQGLRLRDLGLRTDDALSAISALKESLVPILGGDVYLEQLGSVRPGYANWYVDRRDQETRHEFVVRSCLEAEDYIAKFPRRAGEQPLFVLVPSLE